MKNSDLDCKGIDNLVRHAVWQGTRSMALAIYYVREELHTAAASLLPSSAELQHSSLLQNQSDFEMYTKQGLLPEIRKHLRGVCDYLETDESENDVNKLVAASG